MNQSERFQLLENLLVGYIPILSQTNPPDLDAMIRETRSLIRTVQLLKPLGEAAPQSKLIDLFERMKSHGSRMKEILKISA